MKRNRFWLITTALLLCSITTTAHDFEVDGIYYNITSSKKLTVAVTYQGRDYDKYDNEYSDFFITIPPTVTYEGKTYSITEIGSEAFRECRRIKAITLPESITKINICAFCDCDSLISISIPKGITTIGKQAFFNCWQLPSITLPEGIKKIETSTFFNCGSLTSITIPESVTEIEGKAFYGCSNLMSIILPKNITRIRDEAFKFCNNLYKILNFSTLQLSKGSSKHGEIAYYAEKILTGDELTTIGDFQIRTSDGKFYLTNYIGNNTNIVLPNKFNESNYFIDDYAFYNCNKLDSIYIPEAVMSIGEAAFRGCKALTYATIPYGIEEIKDYTFYKCISLDSINIPETTNYIGNYAFYGCDSLKCITMPDTVISIGNHTFQGCISLSSINIPKDAIIGDYAFYGCNKLSTITMLGNIISIGKWGFNDCDQLDSVSAYSIENWCNIDFNSLTANPLYYAKRLFINGELVTNLTIPEGVTSIGSYAFYNCDSIIQITIPNSIETIGEDAFYGCYQLDKVSTDSITHWCDIAFNSPTANPLFYARRLYINGELVTNLSIPEEVSSIGDYTFYNCISLDSINIPKSTDYIGEDAFYGCDSVKAIYCNATTPPTCFSENTFHGIDKSIPIYVPHSSIDIYKTTKGWNQFSNYIGTDTSIDFIDSPCQYRPATIYDLSGRSVKTPTKGIYIINGKQVLIK